MEYQCEVDRLLSPEEFKTNKLIASTFPLYHHKDTDKSSTHSEDHAQRHPPLPAPPPPYEVADWPVYVQLTNGKTYGCDLVVSATGVVPNSDVMRIERADGGAELKLSSEDGGGILVDSEMRSSLSDIYAAGDVCTVQWKEQAELWFQVKFECSM